MNYRHVYMLIVEHAKSEMKNGLRPLTQSQKSKFENQYFEFHHILPKSLFPKWSKRKLNLVALTAREHFFCHQLLTKIYDTPEMHLALWYLCNDNQNNTKINSKTYETIRKNHQIAQKIIQKQRANNEAYKLKCSERKKDYWQKLDSQKRTEIGLKSYNHRSEYDKKHILDKAMEWRKSNKEEYSRRLKESWNTRTDRDEKRKRCLEWNSNPEIIQKRSTKVLCIETNEVFNTMESLRCRYGKVPLSKRRNVRWCEWKHKDKIYHFKIIN